MAYVTQTDLEDALGIPNLRQIFDDDHDGYIDERALASCIAYADAKVDSYLRTQFDGPFPLNPVPIEVKYAALDFAIAYCYRRQPAIVRAMGEQSWTTFMDRAEAEIGRFLSGRQRISSGAGDVANQRTYVRVGTGGLEPDGEPDRIFDDMGTFR